jgi:hypothetical protein
MKFANAYRENAQDCLALAEQADDGLAAARYKRMSDAWYTLATEQEVLDRMKDRAEDSPDGNGIMD